MTESSVGHAIDPISPLAKAEGAFLALAAGDALGWPQEMIRKVRGSADETTPHVEFRTWTRRSGGRSQPYEESHPPRRVQRRYSAHTRGRKEQNGLRQRLVEGVHDGGASTLDDIRAWRRRRNEASRSGVDWWLSTVEVASE